jgi:hypothetical protein
VWELSRVTGEPHGGWVHWGPPQNITQTGDLLILRQAHRIFLGQFGRILGAMAELAERGAEMERCRAVRTANTAGNLRLQGRGLDR